MKQILVLLIVALLVPTVSFARHTSNADGRVRTSNWSDVISQDRPEDQIISPRGLSASAAATTLVLLSSKFDSGMTCTANGWTSVDVTAQTGDWWHVDDFTTAPWAGTKSTGGITFSPVQGTRSMWMAALPPAAGPVNTVLCGYASLPGYGNEWDQAFCSKACLTTGGGPSPDLDIAFKLKFDSEPSYDGTSLEYTTDCSGNVGWTEIDGGVAPAAPAGGWSGPDSISVARSYPVGPGPIRVRLHFTSDSSWSSQDASFPYFGFGVAVDSLTWEGLPVEDFETTALGSNSSTDWQSCNTPGFGNYLALFKKVAGANYEDPCLDNVGCYWAALNGSTEFYACDSPSQPTQKIVPHGNARGQFIANEIWSPVITLGGSGSEFRLRYTVYRDLPYDNLVFHVWRVRTFDAGGCPGPWKDRGQFYYGDGKDWAIVDNSIGPLINTSTASAIQAALGVVDMCELWCGVNGSGACHSPAPYFDSVKVLRVDTAGPQWDVRSVDLFQDTFATDGTVTGVARADAAIDVAPATSATIAPGDSAVVFYLVDPKYVNNSFLTTASGLINDPTASTYPGPFKTKNAVYGYFTVQPFSALKIGPAISEGPGGTANRYPFMGTVTANGKTWAKVRMDYTYTPCAPCPPGAICDCVTPVTRNRFNIDLNDNLFTAGDTVSFFFSATSLDGTTYYSENYGSTTDLNAVAANPMEFTILPAGGYHRGGQFLYVDGADGLGNQPFWDGAMNSWSLMILTKTDRYDVRDPSSHAGNTLAGRVKNVATQLSTAYKNIFWDTGTLPAGLGDGVTQKADDYALMNTFLGDLNSPGGIYLCGDDMGEAINGSASASAATFRPTYLPFALVNGNHRLPPSSFRISPTIAPWPGHAYNDGFFIFGGCPVLNDFDVLGASGTSRVEMSYNTASTPDAAVVSNQRVNGNGTTVTVILSGFSFAAIRDDELNGIFDRSKFLRDTIVYMGYPLGSVGAGPLSGANRLWQNYPNPFNPQTTIAFSIAHRALVHLAVYDVNGALVRTLANETRAAGPYTVRWDGRNQDRIAVASGVYFYKLEAGSFTQTKKMVLLK